MNKRYTIGSLAIGVVLILALASITSADITPTNIWKSYFGEAFYNGQQAPKGSIIDAYDPDGVHCGTFTIGANYDTVGAYGMLFVYGDDIYSPDLDEGAESGDLITFMLNHRDPQVTVVSDDIYWDAMGMAEIDLSVDDAIIDLTMVSPPSDRIGKHNSIVRVEIGLRNDGNGLDFYTVEATGSFAPTGNALSDWIVLPKSGLTYAASGEVVQTYIDVVLPVWPGDSLVNEVSFAVFSNLDLSERVEGSFTVTFDDTDVYAIALTDPPIAKIGQPDEWVQFMVGVRNVGNVTDEYSIEAYSDLGWDVSVATKGSATAAPGEEVYLSFEVLIPTGALDGAADLLSYSVISSGDNFVTADGEVILTANSPTDVGEDGVTLLPNSMQLAQNYPNPFNPTTTISYTLPSRSRVSLDIYDVLGRSVDQIDLGTLSSGTHDVEYDGSSLSSGVYFYRLVSDFGNETRKMVLLK